MDDAQESEDVEVFRKEVEACTHGVTYYQVSPSLSVKVGDGNSRRLESGVGSLAPAVGGVCGKGTDQVIDLFRYRGSSEREVS